MNGVTYFFWLARGAVECSAVVPWLSIPAIGSGIGALYFGLDRYDQKMIHRDSLWLMVPFAIPVMILICGAMFQYGSFPGSGPEWPKLLIELLLLSHIPIAGFQIWRYPKLRLVVIFLSLFQWWTSFCAAIVGAMSVTNCWL